MQDSLLHVQTSSSRVYFFWPVAGDSVPHVVSFCILGLYNERLSCRFQHVFLQAITKMLRDPRGASQAQLRLQAFDHETAHCMLVRLQADIQNCVDCDRVYSPAADAKRQLIGETVLPSILSNTPQILQATQYCTSWTGDTLFPQICFVKPASVHDNGHSMLSNMS